MLARKWWLPPRGLRAALRFARPPAMAPRASWLRGPGPPPPLVRFAPSLLGPALFWSGGVVARGLGVFRPCGGGDAGLWLALGIPPLEGLVDEDDVVPDALDAVPG